MIHGAAWSDAYALIRELRPHLTEAEFTARCREAGTRDAYTMYGLYEGEKCLGALGMRRLVDLLHGPHFYIDDLVVDETARSRELGARLLGFAKQIAAEAGGLGLRWCTGIDYWPARHFYEREGWTARAAPEASGQAKGCTTCGKLTTRCFYDCPPPRQQSRFPRNSANLRRKWGDPFIIFT
jgi:GNAT superfamily N-acetyltransferase